MLGEEIVECEVHGVTSGAVTLGQYVYYTEINFHADVSSEEMIEEITRATRLTLAWAERSRRWLAEHPAAGLVFAIAIGIGFSCIPLFVGLSV